MDKEQLQWDIIEKAKLVLINWSSNNNVYIHEVYFVPMNDFSLEVYIFYRNDNDIILNKGNGISDDVKQIFLKTLSDMDYFRYYKNNISFIFDSHENVVKNYSGSYFFRLR